MATDIMNIDVMARMIDRKFLSIANLQIVMGMVMHVQGEAAPAIHVHIGFCVVF
jgi:hypothetical protein